MTQGILPVSWPLDAWAAGTDKSAAAQIMSWFVRHRVCIR